MFDQYGVTKESVVERGQIISRCPEIAQEKLHSLVNVAEAMLKRIKVANFTPVKKEIEIEAQLHIVLKEVLTARPIDPQLLVRHRDSADDKVGGRLWADTKAWADVKVLGKKHSGDIVLRLADRVTLRCEVKWANERVTSALQTILGQALISSLRHPITLAVLFVQGAKAAEGIMQDEEALVALKRNIARCHNIFLAVVILGRKSA